jgi:hypothetical protein
MFLIQTSFGAEQIEKSVNYNFDADESVPSIFKMVGKGGALNIENNLLKITTNAGATETLKIDISDWSGSSRKKGLLTYSFDYKSEIDNVTTSIMVGTNSTKSGNMLAALTKTRLLGYDGAQTQAVNEWLSVGDTNGFHRVVLQFDFAQKMYTCSMGGKTVSHSFDYFADKTADEKIYNCDVADKFILYFRTYYKDSAYNYYLDNFKAEYTERYVQENVERCVNFIKTINNNSTVAEFKNALIDVSNLVGSYGDYNTKIVAEDNEKAIAEIQKILSENGPYDESEDIIDVVIPEIMEIIKSEMPMISINKANTPAEIKYSLSTYSDKYAVDISFTEEYTDNEKSIFYNAILDYRNKNGAFTSNNDIAAAISEAKFTVDSYAAFEKYKAANALTLPSVFEEYKDLLEIDMSYIEAQNRNQTLFILKTMTVNSYSEIPEMLKKAYEMAKENRETFSEAHEYKTDYNRGPITEKETTVLPNEAYFVDMTNHIWAQEAVEYLYNKNIVNGKSERIFAPYDNITREEFVKLIVTAFDIPMTDKNTNLKDVNASEWYAPYINAACSIGIVQGNGNGYFGVGEYISREDVAVILYRTANVKDIPLIVKSGESFGDTNEISEYARNPVSVLRYNEIINGLGEDIFGPKLNTSRAEAAVLIYKLLGV